MFGSSNEQPCQLFPKAFRSEAVSRCLAMCFMMHQDCEQSSCACFISFDRFNLTGSGMLSYAEFERMVLNQAQISWILRKGMKQSFWVVFSVTGYIEIRWNSLQFQGTVLSCSCMWRQKGIWCNIGNINVKMWRIFVSRRMPRWLARMWALCGVWPTQTARSTDYQRSFRFSQKKMKRNQKNIKEQLNDSTHSKHHWRRSCASCSFV